MIPYRSYKDAWHAFTVFTWVTSGVLLAALIVWGLLKGELP